MKTTLTFQMKSDIKTDKLFQDQRLFSCNNPIDPYKCPQCAGFETHNLTLLKHHFQAGHTYLDSNEKGYDCENCSFQTYSNCLFLKHKFLNLCVRQTKTKFEATEGTKKLQFLEKETDLDYTGNKKSLKCDHCLFKTKYKYSLKNHLLSKHITHENIQWFECAQCSYKSRTKSCLRKHTERKHETRKFLKCDKCPFETECKLRLNNHVLRKHTELEKIQWLECSQCSYRGKTKSNLRNHLYNRHGNKKYSKCDQCSFETKSNFMKNMESDQKIQWSECAQCSSLKCDLCSFETKSKYSLKNHALSKHTDLEKIHWFKCAQCSHKSKTSSSLQKHIERKHGFKKHVKCDHCPFETESKLRLKDHVLSRHTEPEKVQWFECDQCTFKAKTRPNLRNHVYNQHGSQNYVKCEYCGCEIKFRYMKNHILTKHTDVEKIQWFHCAQCPYKAKTKYYLKKHITFKHDEIVNLKCGSCPFETKFKENLKRHILQRHTDPDNTEWFHCGQCSYKTQIKLYLRKHVSRHQQRSDKR